MDTEAGAWCRYRPRIVITNTRMREVGGVYSGIRVVFEDGWAPGEVDVSELEIVGV